MKLSMIFLIAMACILTACQPPAATPEALDLDAIRAEIEQMEAAYANAANEKNAQPILDYYADDAIRLPDGKPMIRGKDAIREYVQANMADTTASTQAFQVLEIFADGNLAVEIGSWVEKSEGEEETGKYVSVFEKRDGKYFCILDIWNADDDDEDDDDNGDND
jgi:ketosteroid isomerase-like protein